MKKRADVVIIGGGCMGASTAYHLARRGITDVVILEREPLLAAGSTGRNAGGFRHQFSQEINVRLSIESIRQLEHFQEEVGHEIDFHQSGYLFLVSSRDNVEQFRENVEMQRRLGIAVDMLTPDEARRLVPGLQVEGVLAATFCARDGLADPNGVTMGFAKAARAAGVEICREVEATAINLDQDRVVAVETNRGTISTPLVVNAAGPYARNIGEMVGLKIPVLPYRRHIFITEPLIHHAPATATYAPGLEVPTSRIMVIDFETTFYFHREGAGILYGMGDPDEPPSYNTSVNWEFLEKISTVAVSRLPALAEAGIAHSWAGLYEVTPDAMPIIGRANQVNGFLMINGFSGHGFQHSPAAGRILADLIADGEVRDIDITPFSFNRFSQDGSDREIIFV